MEALRGEFDAAWAQFQTLHSLRLVPETLEAEWSRGRDTYLAFLIPIDDPAVAEHLRKLVRAVEDIPGVEPYPEDYWHITIKGLGFENANRGRPDDVSHNDVQSVAEAVRALFARQPPFDARIGLAAAFPEVVFAEVWDGLPVRELNGRVHEAVPGLVRYTFDGPHFLPHVSLARFTSNDGLSQLKEMISQLREEGAGPTFSVSQIRLIRAHLSEDAPSLETIETYRLK
jgi:2'-5' RNA ligase